MKLIYYLLFITTAIVGCKSQSGNKVISTNDVSSKERNLWYQKDLILDGIPGISLEKWHRENSKIKTPRTDVIVATLDSQIDLNHEDLQGQFWTNTKEIPENGIDDDKNGYIDDIHGWSFLGTKSGNYIVWENFEFIRYVRKWKPFFEGKKERQINPSQLDNFKEYNRAQKKMDSITGVYENWLKYISYNVAFFPRSKDTLKYFFPKENYTHHQLDSLYKIYKINDKTLKQRRLDKDNDLGTMIDFMMARMEYNETNLDNLKDLAIQVDSMYNKSLNINYDERIFIGDNPEVLEKGYGNNKISASISGIRSYQGHNTKVSGIIAANRTNNLGVKGFSDKIKIMPINMSASGDEHDKDITMAIYYAVDNGAKVINMSFGKEFSVHKDWVLDAIRYAADHNVLIVHCSGNDSADVDLNPQYPSDIDYISTKEISNNFINVGSTSKNIDSTFISGFSNYGKENVDLFAPGENIDVAVPENQYEILSGTSFSAPMVSATAALIWLYYPAFTAKDVKHIILNSGTDYDLDVLIPGKNGKKEKFKNLSKSGKVLNVYNAMKLAKEYYMEKK